MDADARRPWLVAAALVLLVALFVLGQRWREAGRPVLVEVRVATASDSDPVFRDGTRHLAPGEGFQLAVALRLKQRGRGEYWISPAKELALGGATVPHDVASTWPESDRFFRIHWSTIESNLLGGELGAKDIAERLRYRTFLAPDLGLDALVEGVLEARNDDFLGELPPPPDPAPGTLRFCARVEVVADPSDIRPVQALSSPGPEAIGDPRLPTVSRNMAAPAGIDPAVGQLFLLPGFEIPPGDDETLQALVRETGRDMAGLTAARLAVSSWTFAATAIFGLPAPAQPGLTDLGTLKLGSRGLLLKGRTLAWGKAVRSGDLLEIGGHWIVLVADDGNGILDGADRVLHCWRRPPQSVLLIDALDIGTRTVKLYRRGGS